MEKDEPVKGKGPVPGSTPGAPARARDQRLLEGEEVGAYAEKED